MGNRRHDGADGRRPRRAQWNQHYSHTPGQTVSLTTSCDRLKLFYYAAARGGSMEFTVDGKQAGLIDTEGELSAGVFEYAPEPGTHDVSAAHNITGAGTAIRMGFGCESRSDDRDAWYQRRTSQCHV